MTAETFSSNFRAEAEALQTAAGILFTKKNGDKHTDVKSVVSILKSEIQCRTNRSESNTP